MIEQGLVSVMMPAYNGEDFIEQAVDSLLSQQYDHWELIVINDGSTDRTPEIVEAYSDSRIHLYHQTNGGEASARNAALRRLRGEFIAFLDTDDIFLPNHLQLAVDCFGEHPQADAVYTNGYYMDTDGKRLERLSERRRGPFRGNIFEHVIRASDAFGPPLVLVLKRKSVLDRNLSYDESVGLGTDWDFAIRFSETAWFEPIDEVTCQYRVHDANLTLMTTSRDRRHGQVQCRQHAIKMKSFGGLPLDVQVYSFYDLLVELLSGNPGRQEKITQWPEFIALPDEAKARIFRLMAGRALSLGVDRAYTDHWFSEARRMSPDDPRNFLLYYVYKISPALCKQILQARSMLHMGSAARTPFGILD